jgi:hypothetical protein
MTSLILLLLSDGAVQKRPQVDTGGQSRQLTVAVGGTTKRLDQIIAHTRFD